MIDYYENFYDGVNVYQGFQNFKKGGIIINSRGYISHKPNVYIINVFDSFSPKGCVQGLYENTYYIQEKTFIKNFHNMTPWDSLWRIAELEEIEGLCNRFPSDVVNIYNALSSDTQRIVKENIFQICSKNKIKMNDKIFEDLCNMDYYYISAFLDMV